MYANGPSFHASSSARAVAADHLHRSHEAIDAEPGGEDQDVQLVQLPVRDVRSPDFSIRSIPSVTSFALGRWMAS